MPSLYNISLLSSGTNGRLDPVPASQFNFVSNNAGSVILGSATNRMCGNNNTILAGENNLITGITTPGAEILGSNLIGGGSNNFLTLAGSAALGSTWTCLSGINSTIIASTYTTVKGNNSLSVGNSNTICGDADSILGGTNNSIKGRVSSIMGGNANTIASCCNSIIGGGCGNTVGSACFGFLGGGGGNYVGGIGTSIVGGDTNYAACILAFLGGGQRNVASACFSVIGGGAYNQTGPGTGSFTMENYQVVVGGNLNKAICAGSFVGGGFTNHASGCYSSILGGANNCTASNSCHSIIGGGKSNISYGVFNFIGGGELNCTNNAYSNVVGGLYNCALADYSAALAGRRISIPTNHSGSVVISDGQDRPHNSSGSHSLTLDFASGVRFAQPSIIGNINFTSRPTVNQTGVLLRGEPSIISYVSPPNSPSSVGISGSIALDSKYVYFCTATNTWIRTALASW